MKERWMSQEERVETTATEKLRTTSHRLQRSVSCRYRDGALRLDGMAPSFFLKQMTQSLLQGIDGVMRVDNALVVVNAYGVSSEPA